ncbi:hypothetical protein ACFYUV_09775 [Nonomuraea sp. NPDC003560]|uniref:hypothetical protein n=1 Tax=Nonomuraea sp. NPDC003560 TaxID=3364341 RepID=UPI0036CE56A1
MTAGEGRRLWALGEMVEDRQASAERLVEDAALRALLASLVNGLAPRQVRIMSRSCASPRQDRPAAAMLPLGGASGGAS